MREYELSYDSSNIFIANFSEIKERFDPEIILYNRKLTNQKYETRKLSELLISSPQYGANERGIDRLNIETPRYIRITDINDEGELSIDLGKTAEIIEKKYYLNNDDILIARSGNTVGKSYIHKESLYSYDCFFAGYMIRFKLKKEYINPDYFFIYTKLSYYKDWIKAIQRTAGQPNINAEEYKSLLIPIPSMETQENIVTIYSKAYRAKQEKIQEANKILSGINDYLLNELDIKLPEIDNSLENRIFEVSFSQLESRQDPYFYIKEFQQIEKNIENSGCPVRYLKDIFEINRGGSPRPIHDYYTNDDDGLNWIRIGDTKSDSKYISQTSRKIKPSGARSSRKVIPGDFLLSNSMSFGRPYIMRIEGYIHDGWLLFRPKTELVNQDFLHSMLSSKLIYRLFSKATIGGVVENLNIDLVKNIKIPLPSLEKQNEIADHISNIRQAAQQLEQEANEIMENAKAEVEGLILGQ
ncbi:restriction endonuclease subunit S [Psychrobacter celer]|uniref:restriction endonuclease subunit S n=1 Tax=Psychrobacter celer TaxID=306572 RepID=UPI003FD2A9DA